MFLDYSTLALLLVAFLLGTLARPARSALRGIYRAHKAHEPPSSRRALHWAGPCRQRWCRQRHKKRVGAVSQVKSMSRNAP
jgi:hypothetical protein